MTPRKTLKLLSKQLTIREDDWNDLLVFFWAASIATGGLIKKRRRRADSLCLSFKSYSSKGKRRLQVYLGFPRLNRLRKTPPPMLRKYHSAAFHTSHEDPGMVSCRKLVCTSLVRLPAFPVSTCHDIVKIYRSLIYLPCLRFYGHSKNPRAQVRLSV